MCTAKTLTLQYDNLGAIIAVPVCLQWMPKCPVTLKVDTEGIKGQTFIVVCILVKELEVSSHERLV